MNHWLLDEIAGKRALALYQADRIILSDETEKLPVSEFSLLHEVITFLEIAVVEFISNGESHRLLSSASDDLFYLMRALPMPEDPLEAGRHLLKACSFALIGGTGGDIENWFFALQGKKAFPVLPLGSAIWPERCQAVMINCWLQFFQRKDYPHYNTVKNSVAALRGEQKHCEHSFLESLKKTNPSPVKDVALELLALYDLLSAANFLASFLSKMERDFYTVSPEPFSFFKHALIACNNTRVLEDLSLLTQLLSSVTRIMMEVQPEDDK